MHQEYLIAPSQRSLDIIVDAGFRILEFPREQFNNLSIAQRKINGIDKDTLTAKVFSLAFPYEHALTQQSWQAREWSSWLGTAEYKLGRLMAEQDIRNNLFNKSLEHLLVARQKGDNSKENASKIGSCYFNLKQYTEALPFLLESRQKGNISKENASKIGNCYFELNQYEEGLNEYEKALELAKQERFSSNWMFALDHALENSYWLLDKARETIQSPFYEQLVQRFKALYNNFTDFWKANEPNKYNFRLKVASLSSQTCAIGVGSEQSTLT